MRKTRSYVELYSIIPSIGPLSVQGNERLLIANIYHPKPISERWERSPLTVVSTVNLMIMKYNETLYQQFIVGENRERFANCYYGRLWKQETKVATESFDYDIIDDCRLEPYVNWLADYITRPWSFRVKSNLNRCTARFEFYFENKIDAGFFGLRWR